MALVVRSVTAEPDECLRQRERGARAGSSRASGSARIPRALGDGDQSRVRRRPLADNEESGQSVADNGSAGAVRGLASSADAGSPATLSQLLALGQPLDGALSNQREDRTEWGGRHLPAGPCSGGRCSRRQFAAWKLHSAVGREACRAAKRGNRGDARSGNAACTGGFRLYTAGL